MPKNRYYSRPISCIVKSVAIICSVVCLALDALAFGGGSKSTMFDEVWEKGVTSLGIYWGGQDPVNITFTNCDSSTQVSDNGVCKNICGELTAFDSTCQTCTVEKKQAVIRNKENATCGTGGNYICSNGDCVDPCTLDPHIDTTCTTYSAKNGKCAPVYKDGVSCGADKSCYEGACLCNASFNLDSNSDSKYIYASCTDTSGTHYKTTGCNSSAGFDWNNNQNECVSKCDLDTTHDKTCNACTIGSNGEPQFTAQNGGQTCGENMICSNGACLCNESFNLSSNSDSSYTYASCTDASGDHYKITGCTESNYQFVNNTCIDPCEGQTVPTCHKCGAVNGAATFVADDTATCDSGTCMDGVCIPTTDPTPPTPICSTATPTACTTEEACTGLDGDFEWNGTQCVASSNGGNDEPEDPTLICSSEHLELCTTEDTCEGANGYWCSRIKSEGGITSQFIQSTYYSCVAKGGTEACPCPSDYTSGRTITRYWSAGATQQTSDGATCTTCPEGENHESNGFGETQVCCPGYAGTQSQACTPCSVAHNRISQTLLTNSEHHVSAYCIDCDYDNQTGLVTLYTAENTTQDVVHDPTTWNGTYQVDSHQLQIAHTACNCPVERPFVDGQGNCVRCGLYNTHWDTVKHECVCNEGYVPTNEYKNGYLECVLSGSIGGHTTSCTIPTVTVCFDDVDEGEEPFLPECTVGCEVNDGVAVYTPAENDTPCSIGTCQNGICKGAVTCTTNADCDSTEYCNIPGPQECFDEETQCVFEKLGVSYRGLCRPLGDVKKNDKYTYSTSSMSWWAAKNWCEQQDLVLAPAPTDGYVVYKNQVIHSLDDFSYDLSHFILDKDQEENYLEAYRTLQSCLTSLGPDACAAQWEALEQASQERKVSDEGQEIRDLIDLGTFIFSDDFNPEDEEKLGVFWLNYKENETTCTRYNITNGVMMTKSGLNTHGAVGIPYEVRYNSAKLAQYLSWFEIRDDDDDDDNDVTTPLELMAMVVSASEEGIRFMGAPLCVAK